MSQAKLRRKKQIEPLDWKELAEAPALRGLEEALTPFRELEHNSRDAGLLLVRDRATMGATPTVGVTPSVAVVPTRAPVTVGVTPTVGGTISLQGSIWVDGERRAWDAKRVRQVRIAQHSMTQGERILYEALWHCRDANGMGKFKTFSLGYDRIAFTASVDEKTVRVSVPKLISKRILDLVAVENSATRTGRTYRIYSYESILERQRAAGLTHIIKNGKAVEFVWQTGSVAPTVGVPPTVGGTTTVGVTPTVEAVRTLGSTSATTLRALALTIRDHLGSPIDDALLQEMVTACHTNAIATAGAPAPDEALLEFVAQKAPEVANFARRGRVETTPARVLVAAVTRCFEGEAYRGYVESRAAKQQEALTSAARQVEQQAALQAEMAELEARAAKWTTVCDRHKTAEGRYDLKAIAEDLKMDEKGREAALAQMQRLGRFSQVGL